MLKIYVLEFIGEGPRGDKYYDLYGPSNSWIGQYPSREEAKQAAKDCAERKGYKNISIREVKGV